MPITYRVRYKITGWVEVEASSEDDAIETASKKDAAALDADTVGQQFIELDEVEEN